MVYEYNCLFDSMNLCEDFTENKEYMGDNN